MALDKLPELWYIFFHNIDIAHAIEDRLYRVYDIEPPLTVRDGNADYYVTESDIEKWEIMFYSTTEDSIDLGNKNVISIYNISEYTELDLLDLGIDIDVFKYIPWYERFI